MIKIIFLVEGYTDAIFLKNLFLHKYPYAKSTEDKKAFQLIVDQSILFQIKYFSGKQDLLSDKAFNIILSYINQNDKIYLMFDKDKEDCKLQKDNLLNKFKQKEISTNSIHIIICCYEIESWFLGDKKIGAKILKNRSCDKIEKPSLELKLQDAKQKEDFINEHSVSLLFQSDKNKSQSFQYFIQKCEDIFL